VYVRVIVPPEREPSLALAAANPPQKLPLVKLPPELPAHPLQFEIHADVTWRAAARPAYSLKSLKVLLMYGP
jgi:hypothetical protein